MATSPLFFSDSDHSDINFVLFFLTMNFSAANHMEFGVVNPTYDAENLNNEARYPHLSVRAPAPPPAASKLESCATDRRTSGCYEDPEEERYTTLKNVSDEPTGHDSSSDGKVL